MKKTILFICYLLISFIPLAGYANNVIITGNVKYSNGQPAINKEVILFLDSTNNSGCYQPKVVKTNIYGSYSDTLSCNYAIKIIEVRVQNCTLDFLTDTIYITDNSMYVHVSSNFTLCGPDTTIQPTPCNAAISFEKLQGRTFRFSSKNSVVDSSDSIEFRKWIFSDGSKLEGKEISQVKEFKDTGTYNVCLIIQTKKGCESKTCTDIIVRDSISVIPVSCKAMFVAKIDGRKVVFTSNSTISGNDSIVKFSWLLGTDGEINTKSKELIHEFSRGGKYQICLKIKTAKGCESNYCATIEIPNQLSCKATFSTEKIDPYEFRFNSSKSFASDNDTITQRIWVFEDGSKVDGNIIHLTKKFKDPGLYSVCLIIKSAKGCEASYCDSISVGVDTALSCKTYFNYSIKDGRAQFFASDTTAMGDSVISRTWSFGDSTPVMTGNNRFPIYQYKKPGEYYVCLSMRTAKGCESRYCTKIKYQSTNNQCIAKFTEEKISPKKIRFNSNSSSYINGDSIIERKWRFGDGTQLNGNIIAPEKEYGRQGIYTVCLQIKTAAGCTNEICKVIEVKDSTANSNTSQRIKILQISPNPVVSRFVTIIRSKIGIEAEISIHDLYGIPKWKTKKSLLTGNNFIEISAINLKAGPYFLRVTSAIGNDSMLFYKL